MKCLIRQPAGLGDILFCLKIAFKLSEMYEEVVWPVSPYYKWLPDYLRLPDNVNMSLTTEDDFPNKELYVSGKYEVIKNKSLHYYPLELAGRQYKDFMNGKYKLAELNHDSWIDYVKINRNMKKENLLREKFPEKYNLICNTFATPPDKRTINIVVENEYPNIYIDIIKDFTPFDWMLTISNAQNIYFVDTCFVYLVEYLQLIEAKDKFFYPRNYQRGAIPSYIATKHLFKTNWTFIQ